MIRTVGTSSFSDSIITFLRGFNNKDNIEALIDQNQNLMAFDNGCLYDIRTNGYRRIEKDDFITKTMRIPYSSSIPDSKTEEIYRIIYSFFEDKEKTQYLLKVLGISLFTNKHEQLNKTY